MRRVLFWAHLIVGGLAAVVILVMSVTGVLLMYERQVIEWADSEYRSSPPAPGAEHAPVNDLVTTTGAALGATPTAVTLHSDPTKPAEVAFGRGTTVFVDAYSGQALGEGSRGVRRFFGAVTAWHRWLGASGASRQIGRAVTGAANLAFLFLALSGMYLWLPRTWTRQSVKTITLFRRGLSGKARDFNWHHVIGFWSLIPLVLVIASGVVISYPWASDLVYRLAGSEPPPARRGGGFRGGPSPRSPGGNASAALDAASVNRAWAAAEQAVPGWRSLTLRLGGPSAGALSFSVEKAHRGRPDLRYQVAVDRQTGELMGIESFADYDAGRKARSWLRWIHTGEAGGFVGQTLAGVVSAGAVVLVWTGLALSLRRFLAWKGRRR